MVGCAQNDDYIGAEYLGAPYVNNPLGEESNPDADPLYRTDAFDCTTFVETALAGGDVKKLNQIRYCDGNIDFINRNHFIETDWIVNNSGLVANVSSKYAPVAIRNVTIDKRRWFKKVYGIDTQFAKQSVALEYIPYKYAKNISVPEPKVVLFIEMPGQMPQKIGTDLAVRHMGFLLPDGRLRHASSTRQCVVDADFRKYINQMMENKNNLGIMLLEIKK
ncbi:MAG: DUF1460 domain-containing protein [Alphaproteobacteria bacterium]|nr:DUF1460 domain-containing protein [Alphaproteobacteria bacterium]